MAFLLQRASLKSKWESINILKSLKVQYWGIWNHSLSLVLVALGSGEKKSSHSKFIPGSQPLVKQKHSPASTVLSQRTPVLQLWKKLIAVNLILTEQWYPKHLSDDDSSKGTIGIFFWIWSTFASTGIIAWSWLNSKIVTQSWPIWPVHLGSIIRNHAKSTASQVHRFLSENIFYWLTIQAVVFTKMNYSNLSALSFCLR
jgi:hypothetical protein